MGPCARIGGAFATMSRYQPGHSHSHDIERHAYTGGSYYRMSWTVDYYYRGSWRLRPRRFERDTDYAGALRLCRKWELLAPEPEEAP
jgi:hypothetical protein